MLRPMVVLSLFLASIDVHAAIVHLSHDVLGHNLGAGSQFSITVPSVGSNNLMVAAVSWCCDSTVPTLSDDKGNVWAQAGPSNGDGWGDYLAIFYALATTPGTATVTVNSNSGGSPYITISYAEFSGVSLVSPYDTGVTAVSGGPASDTGPLTPSVSGELLICASSYDSNEVPSAGTGFTLMGQYGATNSDAGLGAEYQIYNSLSAVHGIQNYVGTGSIPTVMVAFKPGAAAAVQVRHRVFAD